MKVSSHLVGSSWAPRGRSLVLAVAFLVGSASSSLAETTVYVGPGMIPFEVSGMANIHASDWENYGLGSSEGRVNVPLGSGNTSGYSFGAKVGVEDDFGYLPKYLPAAFEAGFYFGDMLVFNFGMGVTWKPFYGESWSVGLTPRIGFSYAMMSFGEVEVLPGKTPPVITPIGTFNEGDSLKAQSLGILASIGINGAYKFTKNIGLLVEAGFHYAYMFDMVVKAGDVELPMDAPSLVKDDGSSTQAGLDPKAQSLGALVFLGVSYTF